ncbi:MAG: acylphosphatase [Candidatus Diapherotrites archaeon]|nr:acylphosphatase [Candidatus Diapherotrites archaeon]
MGALELIVTGNVQRVGYRNIVSQAAFELGIKGYAENLPDESVKIVVQGDKARIKKFIDKIKIRNWPINVENIKQRSIATKITFKRFTINRGKPTREMAERADEAALYMHKMYDEMHSFRKETNGNFGKLDVKYGSLSNKMDGFSGKLAKKMDNVSSKLDGTNQILREDLSKKMDSVSGKLDSTNRILREDLSNKMDDVSGKLDDTNRILKEDLSNKMDSVSGKLDDTNRILKEDLSNKMDNVSGKLDSTNLILKEEFSKLSNALLIIANKAIQK